MKILLVSITVLCSIMAVSYFDMKKSGYISGDSIRVNLHRTLPSSDYMVIKKWQIPLYVLQWITTDRAEMKRWEERYNNTFAEKPISEEKQYIPYDIYRNSRLALSSDKHGNVQIGTPEGVK